MLPFLFNRFGVHIHHTFRRAHQCRGNHQPGQFIDGIQNFFHFRFGFDIAAYPPAVADHGSDIFRGPVIVFEDFPGFFAMLIRKLFIIQIMNQADNAPFFFILTPFAGHIAHNAFHCHGMFYQAFVFIVLFQQRKRFFPGRCL